ncbi:MAG TPA: M48 family metalloprotease [Candidatus Sulfotelmatobacter sp.]|nr:M48 family metalloprotease [Candidatus Sulfotelmatobacter sp.]
MNWASHIRRKVPGPRCRLGTAVVAFILSIYPLVKAQAVGVSTPSSVLASSNSESGCDTLQRPLPSTGVIQKDLRVQRAEWALGNKLAAEVDRQNEVITDQIIVEYVNHLERTIADGSELPGCFVVKVLSDPEPNAYSLPGGFIYLTTGLIHVVDNEGQLAAALAHETAHVTSRHMTRIDGQLRFGRYLALFGGPAGYAFRRFFGPFITLKLVRNEEFEADRLGLQYQVMSGYDPLEFCSLLQTVFSEEIKESFFDRLYDSHPLTMTRMRRLQKAIGTRWQPQTTYVINRSEFAQMKSHFETLRWHQPRE